MGPLRRAWLLGATLALALGCGPSATGNDASSHTLADVLGGSDGAVGADANPGPDSTTGSDATTGSDGQVGTDGSAGNPLDPNLDVADPSGAPCTTPGSLGECPSGEVCRFYDSAEGRCESCSPCGNLWASCSASNQCDILFMCWMGQCTNFCTLGTMECGAPADCLNIGHPTHGVCAL